MQSDDTFLGKQIPVSNHKSGLTRKQRKQLREEKQKSRHLYDGLSSLVPVERTPQRSYTNYGRISQKGNSFHSTCSYSQAAIDGTNNPDKGSNVINCDFCYYGITETKYNHMYFETNPAHLSRKEGSYIRQTADPNRIMSSLPLYQKY